MKKPLHQQEWDCYAGKHKATGSRYADKDGHWNCWKHTPYLK